MNLVYTQATFTILLSLGVLASNISAVLKWWIDAWSDDSGQSEWLYTAIGIGILITNGARSVKAATNSRLSFIYFFGIGLILEAWSKLQRISKSKRADQLWGEYIAYFFITTWYPAFFFGFLQLLFLVMTKDNYWLGVINFALNALIVGYCISLSIRRYPSADGVDENRRQVLFWLNSSADYLFRTIPLAIYYFESREHDLYWHYAMLLLLVLFEVGVLATLMLNDNKASWKLVWVLPGAVFQVGSHFAVFIRIVDGLTLSSAGAKAAPPTRFWVLYLELAVRALFSVVACCVVEYVGNAIDDYSAWFLIVAIAAGVNLVCTVTIMLDISRPRRTAKTEQQDSELVKYQPDAGDQATERLIIRSSQSIN